MNLDYNNIFSKTKNVYIFYFFFSLIFSAKFISLYYFSVILDDDILFPSHTNNFKDLHSQDITMIASWARRANENLSIFQLSSNIYEFEDRYHYFSSRGLGLFLSAPFLFFFLNNIFEVIILSFLVYSFINILIISKYFKSKNINPYLLFSLLTIIFGSKLFGGVLNPMHYIEFFKNGFFSFSLSSLYRIPNILINNIFIFIYFLLLIKIYNEQFKNNITLITAGIVLSLITFIDPIIFLIFVSTTFVVTIYFYFIENIINKKLFLVIIIFLFFISLSLIFHINNYLFVINDTLRHGKFDVQYNKVNNFFWTGNFWYSREMFIIPIGMYFFLCKKIKNVNKIEIIFLICSYIFWEISHYLDPIFSSRITNRNFEILLAAIGFVIGSNFIINLKSIYIKNKFRLNFILLFSFIYNFFLTRSYELMFYYLVFVLLMFLIIFYEFYKKFIFKKILIVGAISIFCFQSLSSTNLKDIKSSLIISTETDQKKFFNWVNGSDYKKSKIISLNFGLVLNSEIHTNMFVYFTQITRMPVTMSYDNLVERMNQIFYLYGFNLNDLNFFLKNYKTSWEINNENFTLEINNIALLNKVLFYTKFQTNYNPDLPRHIIIDNYKKFLNDERIVANKFDVCVITELDQKFIKPESFMDKLIKKNLPIYENGYIKAYNCNI